MSLLEVAVNVAVAVMAASVTREESAVEAKLDTPMVPAMMMKLLVKLQVEALDGFSRGLHPPDPCSSPSMQQGPLPGCAPHSQHCRYLGHCSSSSSSRSSSSFNCSPRACL